MLSSHLISKHWIMATKLYKTIRTSVEHKKTTSKWLFWCLVFGGLKSLAKWKGWFRHFPSIIWKPDASHIQNLFNTSWLGNNSAKPSISMKIPVYYLHKSLVPLKVSRKTQRKNRKLWANTMQKICCLYGSHTSQKSRGRENIYSCFMLCWHSVFTHFSL